MSGVIFICHCWHLVGEARDVVKQPIMHRTVPEQRPMQSLTSTVPWLRSAVLGLEGKVCVLRRKACTFAERSLAVFSLACGSEEGVGLSTFRNDLNVLSIIILPSVTLALRRTSMEGGEFHKPASVYVVAARSVLWKQPRRQGLSPRSLSESSTREEKGEPGRDKAKH